MKKTLLAASALLALSVSSANAADPVVEAMYDWTGFYAGLNAGYAMNGDDTVAINPAHGDVGDLSISGFFAGVQAGYNQQFDSFVVGIEGDIQWSNADDSFGDGTTSGSNDMNYFGTLRGRAGFAADRLFIYGTGGLAFGGFDYQVDTTVAPAFSVDENLSRVGYTAGAGIEYAFSDDWTMKLEYLYANFGREKLTDGANHTVATPDFHSVRVGFNYLFN